MTLKTLKDIQTYIEERKKRFVAIELLKAEAAKWYEDYFYSQSTKDFIRYFFNLTEEDLKEQGK